MLIIDDERLVRETLKLIVESAGHQVILAEDGRQGLTLFAQDRPDLVITDILMPEKEGLETITELRRHSNIPIIAVSAGGRIGSVNVLDLAREFGANRIITKPFDHREILVAVLELTRGPPSTSPAI